MSQKFISFSPSNRIGKISSSLETLDAALFRSWSFSCLFQNLGDLLLQFNSTLKQTVTKMLKLLHIIIAKLCAFLCTSIKR